MARSTEITLGDTEFTAHPLNLGEAEDLADALDQFTSSSFKV